MPIVCQCSEKVYEEYHFDSSMECPVILLFRRCSDKSIENWILHWSVFVLFALRIDLIMWRRLSCTHLLCKFSSWDFWIIIINIIKNLVSITYYMADGTVCLEVNICTLLWQHLTLKGMFAGMFSVKVSFQQKETCCCRWSGKFAASLF